MTSSRRLLILLCAAAALLEGCADPLPDAQAAYANGDYALAHRLWQRRAEAGDAEAQNLLANLYYLGLGVPRDLQRAADWYRRAALRGHANAQRNLGTLYQFGRGVDRDYLQAYVWYYAASKNGNAQADAYMETLVDNLTPNQKMQGRALLKRYLRAGDPGALP